MITVKLDQRENLVRLSFKFKVSNDVEKEINPSRKFDETLGSTFQRIYANYKKHSNLNNKNVKNKIKEKLDDDETSRSNNCTPLNEEIPFFLYDLENKLVPLETKNIEAWKEGYKFKLKDQEYKVTVNLPSIKKLSLPKVIIAGMPVVIRVEFNSEEDEEVIGKNMTFKWFCSEENFPEENKKSQQQEEIKLENIKWKLIAENVSQRMIIMNDDCGKKLIKVECIPKDKDREGLAVSTVSAGPALEKLEIEKLAMTRRHKETQNRLEGNSIRVTSYNILAKCYSDTSEKLHPYCPPEYLDFYYRKLLLINEIKNYNSDIIFLQESESDFLFKDLKPSMPDYTLMFKCKSSITSNEGEAILFRSDRFRFVKSFDISISNELANNLIFEDLWKNICKNNEFKELIQERGTVLQVILVESLFLPGHYFLLANTHLYYHRKGDFVRLIQSIVSIKYIKNLKSNLNLSFQTNNISLLFAGDFNSSLTSQSFKYITGKKVPLDMLENEKKLIIESSKNELQHSLNLTSYSGFKFTFAYGDFTSSLDYVFYDKDSLEMTKVVPLPPYEKIKEFVSLPNKYIPSDHLAIIFEFLIKF